MIAPLKRIGLLTALALGLGGCNIIHTVGQEQLYSTEYVAYIGRAGSLPVEITGNPIGDSDLADQRLLSVINLPQWIIPRKMHLVKATDRGKYHRLVLVFNPVQPTASGDSICADARTETAKPGSQTKIIGALCSSDDNVSRATAEGEVRPGLDNPQFIQLLDDLIMQIMPVRNEDHDTTDCQSPPCG